MSWKIAMGHSGQRGKLGGTSLSQMHPKASSTSLHQPKPTNQISPWHMNLEGVSFCHNFHIGESNPFKNSVNTGRCPTSPSEPGAVHCCTLFLTSAKAIFPLVTDQAQNINVLEPTFINNPSTGTLTSSRYFYCQGAGPQ